MTLLEEIPSRFLRFLFKDTRCWLVAGQQQSRGTSGRGSLSTAGEVQILEHARVCRQSDEPEQRHRHELFRLHNDTGVINLNKKLGFAPHEGVPGDDILWKFPTLPCLCVLIQKRSK